MSSTFSTLYTDIARAIGRYDADGNIDTDGLAISKRAVNFGILLAALLFDPQELKTTGSLTVTANATSVTTSTLTRLRLIQRIYNTTGSREVYYIPEVKFNLIVPTGLTYTEYYYKHGIYLYLNAPTANNTLTVYYISYPAELSNDEDTVSFNYHDSVILAAGTSYAFASLEEGESAKIWDSVLQTFTVPYSLNAKKKDELKEALKASGYNI